MAYYNGVAADMSALRAALITACVDNHGWAWDAGAAVLSKDELFVNIAISAAHIELEGRTAAASGAMNGRVKIGQLYAPTGSGASDPTYEITYPCSYDLFVFEEPDEVYLVVNYDVDRYQWILLARSTVRALPGTGLCVGASMGQSTPAYLVAGYGPINLTPGSAGYVGSVSNQFTSGAWALQSNSQNTANAWAPRNTYVHSGFDSSPWLLGRDLQSEQVGVRSITELLSSQPSAWNSEAALIPMRAYKFRPGNKISLVSDFVNARYIRIDNYEPGQILELGADRWMVFPWHRKNIEARDGALVISRGYDHTGTFGWAIRYEGP